MDLYAIPPKAFKVICKFILKKQFIINFKLIFSFKYLDTKLPSYQKFL